RTGVPAAAQPVLRLRRRTRDSAGLDADSRMANLAGAVAADRSRLTRGLRPTAAGRPTLVLVDDLVTTGASLAEAARALAAVGYPVACAAVVAATARRAGVGPTSAAR
ncbi:MAG: ComF family protein, partial [Actinomycetota bacterium]|nr:ComF family protein [Actinomycetota bacterium]